MSDAPLRALGDTADYPLYVVTAVDAAGRRAGCVAGFATQCSISPVRYLVCVSKVNFTYHVAQQASALALHLLGRHQVQLGALFAEQTGDDVDKFARCEWNPGPHGVPVLAHCAAWAAGSVIERLDAGDHAAMVLSPAAGGAGTEPGLLMVHEAPTFHPGHPVSGG